MRLVLAAAAALALTACVSATPLSGRPAGALGESDDFVVVVAKRGDTAEALARRWLGDPGKAWMVEDWNGARQFTAGQRVVVPRRPWNPTGVEATGYQLVPVLVYHNLGPQTKGRLVLGVEQFTEQMRYLKEHGYRVASVAEFVEWLELRRQLPRKTVVLTFDDGYRSFREHARPVLKALGFTATLFVYTDYVGAGRNALGWEDLRALAAEGFDVQAHSKSHADLRRRDRETDAQYARRMQVELAEPPKVLARQVGRPVTLLAYPYGRLDDGVVARVREHGYAAAFTVRRESNAAFVETLRVSRSQVYSDMTLEQFVKNLDVFHPEDLR